MISIYPESKYPIMGYRRYKMDGGSLVITEDHPDSSLNVSETTFSNPDSECVFLADKWGSNYWHWHFDVFPPVLFLNSFNKSLLKKAFMVSDKVLNVGFLKWWFDRLGVSNFMVGKEESRDGLSVVDFDWRHAGSPNPRVLEMIRSETLKSFPDSDLNILVQRGCQSREPKESRNIENRDEICEVFSRKGMPLTTVFLEAMSVPEQIDLFSRARIVIGVHGAGLTNLMFCKPGTVAVEIESPLASHCMYLRICALIGVRCASLLGDVTELRHNFFHQSLRVDPIGLLDLVELL